MDHGLPDSHVRGILLARILQWIALSSSSRSSGLRDQTHIFYISCIGRQVLYHWCHLGSPIPITAAAAAKSRQSCPTLSDPMDCSLPGSSIHGIFQARVGCQCLLREIVTKYCIFSTSEPSSSMHKSGNWILLWASSGLPTWHQW